MIALVAGSIVSWFILMGIVGPLKSMFVVVEYLRTGDGDLTYRLPDYGKNEIGDTSHSLNGFLEHVQEILIDISSSVESVASMTEMSSTVNKNTQNSTTTN